MIEMTTLFGFAVLHYSRYKHVSVFPLPDQVNDKLRGNDNFIWVCSDSLLEKLLK